MSHAFISYVREDLGKVRALASDLGANGISVWLDQDAIQPGQRWKDRIREAIHAGSSFICCFSDSSSNKAVSPFHEEIIVAIDALRQRPHGQSWFIPVRFEACNIPNYDIGAGANLDCLQRVDMFPIWSDGINQIVRTLRLINKPTTKPNLSIGIDKLFFIRKVMGIFSVYIDDQLWVKLSENDPRYSKDASTNLELGFHAVKVTCDDGGVSETKFYKMTPGDFLSLNCGHEQVMNRLFWRRKPVFLMTTAEYKKLKDSAAAASEAAERKSELLNRYMP